MARNHRGEPDWSDSGWVGAGPDDDLDRRLADAEEAFDETRPHVMTALGPIEPDALGPTLIAGPNASVVGDRRDPGAVLLDLEQLYAVGVRAIVDLTSAASAPLLADLHWVSARSPVHIVVGAGEPASERAVGGAEARFGLTVRSGTDTERSVVGPGEGPVFEIVETPAQLDRALVQARSGQGVRPPCLVASASTLAAEWNRSAALGSGADLALIADTVEPGDLSEVATLCRDLVESGFGDRLLLGYNEDAMSLMERFPVLLMEAGLPAVAVRRLLVENPARALTRQPPAE